MLLCMTEDTEFEDDEIDRGETLVRAAYTVLFLLIARVIETVLLAVILFQLGYALVVQRPPSLGVRRFANRTISYFYRVGRYLTYNDPTPPFPLADLPPEVEETGG